MRIFKIKHIGYWTVIILMVSLAMSCDDRELVNMNNAKGIPVVVQLKYAAPGMSVVSRALSDEEESKVNNLCVLIFDAETGNRKTIEYYDSNSLEEKNDPTNHSSTRKLSVRTTTGTCYIIGVANVIGSQLTDNEEYPFANIYDYLAKKATTWEEFKKCELALNAAGNLTRTTASLVMSGAYAQSGHSNKGSYEPETVTLTHNTTQLEGYIHLRRLDSHISFNIEVGSENIKLFQPVSWKVVNVPRAAFVWEQKEDVNTMYDSSSESIHFDSEDANMHKFDFYMLENRKKAIPDNQGNRINSYADREKEYKNENGTNRGIYRFVEENATFVEIKAKMEIDTDEGLRVADVKYTVHLGYCENPKVEDFNCRRNTRYVYNVIVKGVDNIVVEAMRKGENEPGAEGDVVDAETLPYTLDAHYSTFNIEITEAEREAGLNYIITTPYAIINSIDVAQNYSSLKDNEDFSWIKFRKTTGENILAEYAYDGINKVKPDSIGDLLDLHELKEDSSEGDWYTVFVDEYVYKNKHWSEFVNVGNRQLLLIFEPRYSCDKESSYAKAKYFISQRSIQTYFKADANLEGAIGIEHVNETSKNLNWTLDDSNWNRDNGWGNVASSVQGRKWGEYVFLTQADKSPGRYTFKMKHTEPRSVQDYDDKNDGYYEVMYACLSRNRDENGNGTIDKDELKWYVPGLHQYLDIYLGAESLETPLFEAGKHAVPNNNSNAIWSCRNDFHYASSDKQKIFAEQGCSTNNISWSNTKNTKKWAQEIRCIRNLNKNQSVLELPGEVYEYAENDKIFMMTNLNPRSIRISAVENYWFGVHHNFDTDTNIPYYKFQVAKNDCLDKQSFTPSWTNFVNDGTTCKNYSEMLDGSDKGTWRAPNQKELMLMFKEKETLKLTGLTSSCTKWKYANRYCGINNNVLYVSEPNASAQSFNWRCVRDVK